MKKFLKALAALMASTMLFGAMFTSCSSDDDDDGGDETPKITISSEGGATSVGVGSTLKLTSDVEGVSWTVDKKDFATLSATEDGEFAEVATGTTVYLKGVADGSVTVTASKDGYTDGSVPITVGTGGSGGEEEDDDGSYKFIANDVGSSAMTISETTSYKDGKVTLVAEGNNKFDLAGLESTLTFTEANVDVTGYVKIYARETPTAVNWKTSATKVIAFTVPTGASKVYIFAKSGSTSTTSNITVNYGSDHTVFYDEDAPSTASTITLDVSKLNLAEDTDFYLWANKEKATGSVNLRGIYVQMEQSPLASIEITAQPTKTSYALNETLDTTGIAVTATYENGKTKTVTSKVTYSALDSTAAGDKEITATYTEGGVTRTATFKVTVTAKTLSSIAVKTNPTKTSYKAGETVDLTGLEITATYSDGSAPVVTYSPDNASSFTASPSAIAADTTSVTVTYGGKETSFAVTVKTLASIAVNTEKSTSLKTSYYTDDAVDLTGLVLTLTYSDETTEDLTYSATIGITAAPEKIASDTTAVTVTYSGLSTTFDVTVQSVTYFTKFDAAELYGEATSNVTISAEKTASDGSWTLAADSKNKAVVKKGSFATYDYDATAGIGYSWANRLSFEQKSASLKLKVGAGKSVVLRVDGGGSDSATSYTEGKTPAVFTFKGAGDAVTWSPVVSLSTFYASVTGDSDGYVVITAATAAGANIYGITVVDSAVDLTGKTREEVKYNNPTFTLGETASIEKKQSSVTLDAGAKATKTTFTASVDGTTVKTEDSELTDVTFTYAWSKDGTAIDGATSATYDATAAGSYTVKASYTAADKKTYSATSSACAVTNLNQGDVTVTFNANGGTGTMEDQTLKNGTGTLTANAFTYEGHTFSGWNTNADGTSGTSYTDGQEVNLTENTTLYAVWTEKGNATVNATFSMKSNIGEGKAISATNKSAADLTVESFTAEEGGTGATLAFAGNAKVEDNDLNVQKQAKVTTESFTSSKGYFTLVLSGSANVTVHYKPGSNDSDTARIIVIANSNGESIKGACVSMTKAAEADFTTDSALSSGTYKIYCNGVKIFSVTASSSSN